MSLLLQIWALEQLPPDDDDDAAEAEADEDGGGASASEIGAAAEGEGSAADGAKKRKSKIPRVITGASDSALKIWCVPCRAAPRRFVCLHHHERPSLERQRPWKEEAATTTTDGRML